MRKERGVFFAVIAAVFLVASLAGCTGSSKPVQQGSAPTSVPQAPADVAGIAENYISRYFAPEGEEVKVTSIWEEHGVYGFNVTVMGMNYTSYITRDGKLIFPAGFYTDRAPLGPEAPPEAISPEEPEVPEQ